ncbi:threonine aldolase [Daldinia caldariorum]|uniref:threonine aldolase n=1 Tax=Daldinia caldariorum TaxID=326644 RepID=UPI0020085446|nr:threonine aldolase [Daldinia caldariorum]KAI1467388.1 threonine aldolase [Daldinia caldariorum]
MSTPGKSQDDLAGTWLGHRGPAAFDLRSDVMTTSTPAMLFAVQQTTFLDDVYQEDTTTLDLEAHVASLTGKEAALFVLSGTMGNQISLRTLLTQPPHGVLADHRSHIIVYEAGGVSSLSGAMITPVVPSNGVYLTLEDIKSNIVLGDDVHSCPTRVISLENTLDGLITPLDEVRRISEFARENDIRMHCDGARLWEVVASGAGSLQDYCQYFDTVSLCFSKGLGAPIGSIIVGSKPLIKHARWVRKAIGGGLHKSGVVTAAARVAVDVTFGKGPNGEGGLLQGTHATAKRVEKMWTDLGGRVLVPVQTNMIWLDLRSLNSSIPRFIELAKEAGLKVNGQRIITHYQIGEEAIQRLGGVFEKLAAEKGAGDPNGNQEEAEHRGIYGNNS